MNDDELAAVIAAAHIILSGSQKAPSPTGSRWALAARLAIATSAQARLFERGPSRWTLSERFGRRD